MDYVFKLFGTTYMNSVLTRCYGMSNDLNQVYLPKIFINAAVIPYSILVQDLVFIKKE